MRTNQILTRGTLMANGLVPRGPGVGCHVAPWVVVKSLWSPQDSTTRPPGRVKALGRAAQPARPPYDS
jgi:hypothetical protein